MTDSASLVIRNGTIADGSGAEPYEADLAIVDGRIAAIGGSVPKGAEEIDAHGKLVTPGFVDVHTHYDAQVTWSDRLAPSSWNGVTTVVATRLAPERVAATRAANESAARPSAADISTRGRAASRQTTNGQTR